VKTERRRKHGNTGATVRRDLSRLRGVFRLARKRGFVNDAFEHVDLPDLDSTPKVRFLDDDERHLLTQALGLDDTPEYLRAMVTVSLNTGLRRGELFGLTWDNVDAKQHVLTVAATTSKSHSHRPPRAAEGRAARRTDTWCRKRTRRASRRVRRWCRPESPPRHRDRRSRVWRRAVFPTYE
jgi:integrase